MFKEFIFKLKSYALHFNYLQPDSLENSTNFIPGCVFAKSIRDEKKFEKQTNKNTQAQFIIDNEKKETRETEEFSINVLALNEKQKEEEK